MPFIWFHFPISSVTCLHFVVSTAVENYCQLLFWHEVARELFYNQFTRYYTFRPLGRPACARSGVALDTLTSSGTRISWRITFSCIGTCIYSVLAQNCAHVLDKRNPWWLWSAVRTTYCTSCLYSWKRALRPHVLWGIVLEENTSIRWPVRITLHRFFQGKSRTTERSCRFVCLKNNDIKIEDRIKLL